MPSASRLRAVAVFVFAVAVLVVVGCSWPTARPWQALVPRTWDEAALATMELPNAVTGRAPQHVTAEFYYRIPAQTIWRTWPVYHPDREPPGYRESLAKAVPEVAFAAERLVTHADWTAAGESVFHWPIQWAPFDDAARAAMQQQLAAVPLPVLADGTLPFYRLTMREPGKLEIGSFSCAFCHTRVMPDGRAIVGAQGNLPFDRLLVSDGAPVSEGFRRGGLVALFGMPAVAGAAAPFPPTLDGAAVTAAFAAIPPGVLARHGSSLTSPVQVPDLIGIEGRRYLDRTGLVRHRGLADLMRYGALNQDLDMLADHQGFVPDLAATDALPERDPPPGVPTREQARQRQLDPTTRIRYADDQLYAMALFLYALQPPPSPHPFDDLARRGQAVFDAAGCAKCHPAPLYTSNELVPAPGFDVPAALRASERIRRTGVDTDATLTLTTRRATGFYKVPSLRGVWYRGPFEHNGSVATLEDWFDPARLRDDYVPTGWNPGGGRRAVVGHEFGLDLADEDRRALLAFLRTL